MAMYRSGATTFPVWPTYEERATFLVELKSEVSPLGATMSLSGRECVAERPSTFPCRSSAFGALAVRTYIHTEEIKFPFVHLHVIWAHARIYGSARGTHSSVQLVREAIEKSKILTLPGEGVAGY